MTKDVLASLSERQLEIMQVVWQKRETTVAEIWKILSERHGVARNTVQTMIARLEDKGLLKHRAEGKTYYYSATAKRSGALGRMLSRMLEQAFDGSVENLVLALVADRGLSAQEAKRLRAIIREAEEDRK